MGTRYTAEQVARVLTSTKGLVYVAAKQLGCTPTTVYSYMKKFPTVLQACENAREQMVDTAELKFFEAIQNGEPWAIAMMLKTKGRNRGYIERKDLNITSGEAQDRVAEILGIHRNGHHADIG